MSAKSLSIPRYRAVQVGAALVLSGFALGVTAALAQTPGKATGSAKTSGKPAPVASFSSEQIRFFEAQVRPILKVNCFSCHGDGGGPSGGLRLTSRAAILRGGDSGPALSLQKPADSLLLRAINYQGRQMPPTGKLTAPQIDVLTRWVKMGAPWTPGASAADKTPVKSGPPPVNAETMNFWSFRPVKRPAIPAVKNRAWVKNPIDAFILARLEAKNLTPAPPATRTALLRRACYDMTGLPPTPEETQAFVTDTSPNAWEKVVDRLLASPHYGERWGRHWLDLVRYAETNSFERDDAKPFIWRYRDYVIRALNADKPYDQFVKEQLAGDELETVTSDSLIATGYYRLGIWDDEPADPLQARYDELDDLVSTTGQVFLGLTVGCARCHDHKIDPIPQKDYYRFVAIFQGVTRYSTTECLRPIGTDEERRQFAQADAAYHQKLDATVSQLKTISDSISQDLTNVEKEEFAHEDARLAILKKRVPTLLNEAKYNQYVELSKQLKQLRENPPKGLDMALCVTESGRVPPPSTIMLRGNPHVPGDPVEPGFLSVLAPPAPNIQPPASNPQSSGRRLALANWIASPKNQLTARVMVNRLWQFHFGRGIVRSASNFGFLGDPPTHPKLLDWLASEFVRNHWKLKPLHKLILMSNAYRMSSQANPRAAAKDPTNNLFWRFDMRRLDAEEIRDSILAVNGSLNLKMGGPGVYPEIPKEVLAGQSRPGYGWEVSAPDEQNRRSVYVHVKRSLALPILASFDSPETDLTCPVRFATTQPTQALSMLNSAFLTKQAQIFADYATAHAGAERNAQIHLILQRVFQRQPTANEIARGVRFLRSVEQEQKLTPPEALRAFCLVALNLNEFIYLD